MCDESCRHPDNGAPSYDSLLKALREKQEIILLQHRRIGRLEEQILSLRADRQILFARLTALTAAEGTGDGIVINSGRSFGFNHGR